MNHFKAARAVTVAGFDIYHPGQDGLTGAEIAFGGDLWRSIKQQNYLVMETQAQGYTGCTPYPGQLRLQAYSHLANGANMVEYWHWHSIHNAAETYWKGVLSQDFAPNETYQEASRIGNELKAIGSHLVNLKKHNQVAILVSNEALTALDKFRMDASVAGNFGRAGYNDVLRWIYDTFYHMNVECDFISTEATLTDMAQYPVLIVPALYTASDALLSALKQYVSNGGELVTTFKTGFANEDVKVASDVQPHILQEVIGAHYHEFTLPRNVGLKAEALELPSQEEMDALPKVMKHQPAGSAISDCANLLQAELFMELLIPDNGQVLYSYDHPFWGKYAAVVEGEYGKGHAIYIGCKTSEPVLRKIMEHALKEADAERTSGLAYPIVVRQGTNDAGKTVTYFLNYSRETQTFTYPLADGTVLLTTDTQESNRTDDQTIHTGDAITLAPWGVEIVEFWLPPLRQLPSLPLLSMYR